MADRTHVGGNAVKADYSTPGQVKLTITAGDSIGNDGDVLTNNAGVLEMLPPAAPAASGADFQRFNASGTWTKPSGYDADSRVLIRAWGGGGSGGCAASAGAGGGGGGAYNQRWRLLSELGATETVTIGTGGTAVSGNTSGNAGGNTTFGAHLTAYGGRGGASSGSGGGGGGPFGAGSGSTPGTPLLLTDIFINFGGSTQTNIYHGSGGRNTSGAERPGQPGVYHGGGGGGPTATGNNYDGGSSLFAGAGGAGTSTTATGTAGTSVDGGNGGAAGVNGASGAGGVQPGGGGGGAENTGGAQSGSGGDGRVEVFVFPPA